MTLIRSIAATGATLSALDALQRAEIGIRAEGADPDPAASEADKYASRRICENWLLAVDKVTDPQRPHDAINFAACESSFSMEQLKKLQKEASADPGAILAAIMENQPINMAAPEAVAGARGGAAGDGQEQDLYGAAETFRRMMDLRSMASGAEDTDINAQLGTPLPRQKTEGNSFVLANLIVRLVASKASSPDADADADTDAAGRVARRDVIVNSFDTARQLLRRIQEAHADGEWVDAAVSAEFFPKLLQFLRKNMVADENNALVMGPVLLTSTTVHKQLPLPPQGVILPLAVLTDARNLPTPKNDKKPVQGDITLFDLAASALQVSARSAQLGLIAATAAALVKNIVHDCGQGGTRVELAARSVYYALANLDNRAALAMASKFVNELITQMNEELQRASGDPREMSRLLESTEEAMQSLAKLMDLCAVLLKRPRVSAAAETTKATSTTFVPAIGCSSHCSLSPNTVPLAWEPAVWQCRVSAIVYCNRPDDVGLMSEKQHVAAVSIVATIYRFVAEYSKGAQQRNGAPLVVPVLSMDKFTASGDDGDDDDDAGADMEEMRRVAVELNRCLQGISACNVRAFSAGDELQPGFIGTRLLVLDGSSKKRVQASLARVGKPPGILVMATLADNVKAFTTFVRQEFPALADTPMCFLFSTKKDITSDMVYTETYNLLAKASVSTRSAASRSLLLLHSPYSVLNNAVVATKPLHDAVRKTHLTD
ncbi:hypothetical protein HYH02_010274 [Chlamydomonas schloesseri]|uniref:Uncharacterized protein n=1 Tax=Chlamydomonas schloesseri TaxID=2026947 RepID=A0A835W7S4_9CHLO|nr:hypothetical protein HYH02_010274 [Chlamydomonas schloesseri]|eukprot:KAG2440384.1 hypothetical protein HYH02_010274 [Chlamydomonas schloesseri]